MQQSFTSAVATLALAGIACSTPAAQQSAATRQATARGADLPGGWKSRVDAGAMAPAAGAITAEKESITFTRAPAGIYYDPAVKAEKDYTVSATFSELKPSPTPAPYGLFVAGKGLEGNAPSYVTLLVRADGKFQVTALSGTGGAKPVTMVDWTPAPAMMEPKGAKTSNTLTIRALQGAIHFLIADKEVYQMPRAKAGEDGIAGLRIGPGLTLQVDHFASKKFP